MEAIGHGGRGLGWWVGEAGGRGLVMEAIGGHGDDRQVFTNRGCC